SSAPPVTTSMADRVDIRPIHRVAPPDCRALMPLAAPPKGIWPPSGRGRPPPAGRPGLLDRFPPSKSSAGRRGSRGPPGPPLGPPLGVKLGPPFRPPPGDGGPPRPRRWGSAPSCAQPPPPRGARRAGSPRVGPGRGSHPGDDVIAGEGNA